MFKRWRDKKKEIEQVRLATCPGKLAILFCIPPSSPLNVGGGIHGEGWGSRDDFRWDEPVGFVNL